MGAVQERGTCNRKPGEREQWRREDEEHEGIGQETNTRVSAQDNEDGEKTRWRKEVEDSPGSEWEKTGRFTSQTGYLKGPGIGKWT